MSLLGDISFGAMSGPGDKNNEVYEERRNSLWNSRDVYNNYANQAVGTIQNYGQQALGYYQPWQTLTPTIAQGIQNEVQNPQGMGTAYDYLAKRQTGLLNAQLAAHGQGASTYASQAQSDSLANLSARTYQERLNWLSGLNQQALAAQNAQAGISQNTGENIASTYNKQGAFNAEIENQLGVNKQWQTQQNNPMGTIGKIGGAAIGFMLGGPAGAMAGMQIGGGLAGGNDQMTSQGAQNAFNLMDQNNNDLPGGPMKQYSDVQSTVGATPWTAGTSGGSKNYGYNLGSTYLKNYQVGKIPARTW